MKWRLYGKIESSGGGVHLKPHRQGFTLAEVLITIGIIGIVAAMTIQTLSKNIQDRKFITASKRINSMITNSIAMLEANEEITSARDAEDFVKNYLSRYLKISKICGYENHETCGFETKANGIHRIDGIKMTLPTQMDELQTSLLSGLTLRNVDLRGYSFFTINGYSMMLFYNPKCLSDAQQNHLVQDLVQDRICVNILWDMNGPAEPNTVAKDIGFTSVLYPKYSKIVTPLAYPTNTFASFNDAGAGCQTYAGEHYKVPNRDELGSLYFNGILINQINGGYFWTSEAFTEDEGWTLYFSSGYRVPFARSHGYNVRCVRN